MASLFERSGLGFGRVQALILALCATVVVPATAADVSVILNQAKLVKLPEKVATIVVGNPLIADVSLQPGGVMVITGKGYGVTNLIALDRAGNVLMERSLEVQGAENVVVVYRGIERATYVCTPECQPRITLGDSKPFFDVVINQSAVLNAAASAPRGQ